MWTCSSGPENMRRTQSAPHAMILPGMTQSWFHLNLYRWFDKQGCSPLMHLTVTNPSRLNLSSRTMPSSPSDCNYLVGGMCRAMQSRFWNLHTLPVQLSGRRQSRAYRRATASVPGHKWSNTRSAGLVISMRSLYANGKRDAVKEPTSPI